MSVPSTLYESGRLVSERVSVPSEFSDLSKLTGFSDHSGFHEFPGVSEFSKLSEFSGNPIEGTLTPILFHTQIGGHAHSLPLSHSLTLSLTLSLTHLPSTLNSRKRYLTD